MRRLRVMARAIARLRALAGVGTLGALAVCGGADAQDRASLLPATSAVPPPASVGPARSAANSLMLNGFTLAGELTQGGWLRGSVPRGTRALTLDGQPLAFSPDGRFLAAFDRDAGASAVLSATLADGRQVSAPLAIAPRAWQIEHVAVGKRPGAAPSAEFERRRPLELAQINTARAMDTGAQGWTQDFIWPVRGRISGRFGSQRIYRGEPGAYHSGLDIAPGGGVPFVAPADGVVILAAQAPFTLEGNLLMIDHGMGLNSAFLHSARLLVKQGDVVRQGQVLGLVGMTGRATGPHLHWSIKWKDRRLDPLLFVAGGGAR
ncbi:peptidase [Novosphingobium sp. MD-1]|nr:peptidase [Novosphingobium sp. MD-1]